VVSSGTCVVAVVGTSAEVPLPPEPEGWDLPDVIVSPHMSGDFRGWDRALTGLFLEQLERYRAGRPLANVVDKSLGYVPSAAQ